MDGFVAHPHAQRPSLCACCTRLPLTPLKNQTITPIAAAAAAAAVASREVLASIAGAEADRLAESRGLGREERGERALDACGLR
jgi:hypothetical protein